MMLTAKLFAAIPARCNLYEKLYLGIFLDSKLVVPMKPSLSLLAAPPVVLTTTSGAASGGGVGFVDSSFSAFEHIFKSLFVF